MKIPKTLGRRALLKLSALGLLPATVAAAPRRILDEHEQELTKYRLRMVGQSNSEQSLHSPLVYDVADVVAPCLLAPKDDASRLALVRQALQVAYRSDVREMPGEMAYVWLFDEDIGQWVRVCLDRLLFLVSFGRDGTVELSATVDEML